MALKQSDLDILLREGEGTTLEYKESVSSSLSREIVAFSNTLGGKILIGVRDDGTIKGITDSNKLRARIQDIARNCDPPVQLSIQPMGNVLVVRVMESSSKPVQCGDGFFWRQGAVTQKLNRDEICEFFRTEGTIRFDLAPCKRFRYPGDFDEEKFHAWLRKTNISADASVEDVLVNIESAERTEDGLILRNAGVLFFAKEPRRFFNQAYITCLLLKGKDKVNILDRKDLADGIVSDIEESLRFVERNTRTAYRIEGLRREEIGEYPMAALREAITNAVMHRDWFFEGANVFIEIYQDRVEVVSPGGLPKGMETSDLGNLSVRRNPLIADMLHRIAFIEKAGTGIDRMRREAQDQGCREPVFENGNFFAATFFPNPEVREGSNEDAPTSTRQVPDKLPTSIPQAVSILQSAREPRTRKELQDVAEMRNREHFVEACLRPLIAAGLLEMTLPDKPRSPKQRYRCTQQGLDALRVQTSHEER